ncbi:MotE family protein [Thermodesulfobacteriota bacterium]
MMMKKRLGNSCLYLGLMIFLLVLPSFALAGEKKPVRVGPGEIELAVSLKEREQAIELREKELVRREEELAFLRTDVDAKLEKLTVLQQELQVQIAELKQVADKDFKNLIKVYSAMSASRLAPLLNDMDDDAVTRVLKAMKTDQVAKIIPKLDQDKAVRVSRQLGRMK